MTAPQIRHRPIFVLGIDRSGTSLLSEVLFRWGAYPGRSEHLPKGDDGNPQGYWEYGPMEDFIADLYDSVGVDFWNPSFREILRRHAAEPEWRRRVSALAAEMEHPGKPWFWKEPGISFMLPFFSEIFADPVYLITLRNPGDSARSYEKLFLPPVLRDRMRLTAFFFLRWQYLMVAIFEHLKAYQSKLIVPYEALVSSPREQCERIQSFLAAESGLTPDDPGILDRMAEAINPDLWRNHSPAVFLENEKASAAQKDLYTYLSSHVEGNLHDFEPARYPFPACSGEYLANMMVVRWLFQNL